MDEQLASCVDGYIQLVIFLNSNKDHLEDFAQSRATILSGIVCLNLMIPEWKCDVGRLCMAPRFSERINDVCIVTEAVSDGMCSVVWLYPRNIYELLSVGSRISTSKIIEYSNDTHEAKMAKLRSLSYGDNVLVRNSIGLYVNGTISRRMTRGLSGGDNSSVLEVKLTNGKTLPDVEEDLLVIVPYDRPVGTEGAVGGGTGGGEISSGCLVRRNEVKVHHVPEDGDHDNEFSGSSSEDDSDDEDIRRGGSCAAMEGLRSLQAAGHVLGDWEKHTKGNVLASIIIVTMGVWMDGVLMC